MLKTKKKMGTKIENFEDLECWREARKLVGMIYKETKEPPFSKDYGLKEQIQRAAVSVMGNIAEGFETYSDQELIRYVRIALHSCGEVRSHLFVALDVGYLSQDMFKQILEQTKKCSNYIKAFLKYLRSK